MRIGTYFRDVSFGISTIILVISLRGSWAVSVEQDLALTFEEKTALDEVQKFMTIYNSY